MTRLTEIGVLGVASVLAGCLFPSFDDLGGNQPAVISGSKDAGGSDSTTSDAGTTSQQPKPPQGDGGTPPGPAVACGAAGQCDLSIEGCCFTVGGPDCQRLGSLGTCTIQGMGNGYQLSCDGAEDCTGGDVCCYVPGDKTASCKAAGACNGGDILCNGPQPLCSDGPDRCKRNVTIGSSTYKACL